MDPKNALGKMCRDIVLDSKGICTRIDDYLFGCRTYYLQGPMNMEGKENGVPVQEACLEIIDDSIKGGIPVNTYYAPTLLGKEVKDQITKRTGICIARCFPFIGSPQYLFEYTPEKKTKSRLYIVWMRLG